MPPYRAVLVGLTGIGAARPTEDAALPLYGPMPGSHAAAYHRHPQAQLVAVCDLRPEALEQFRQTWSDAWPSMGYYLDYREMLEREKPDLVSVATSDHAHAQIVVDAARGGARAILCEKPIATSLEDADRMIEACEENGALLSVEHTRRWNPLYLKARQLVRSGELGCLRTMVAEMFSPRAMLFRNGTHLIDLLTFFAGTDPEWVVAELEEGFAHFTRYQGDGGRDPAAEPYASAYIHFAGQIRALYNSYKIPFPASQITLTCDQGRIEISDSGARLVRGTSHLKLTTSEIVCDRYQCEGLLAAVAELIHVLENGGELISSGRQARQSLEIILGMLRSHQQGNGRVDFPLARL